MHGMTRMRISRIPLDLGFREAVNAVDDRQTIDGERHVNRVRKVRPLNSCVMTRVATRMLDDVHRAMFNMHAWFHRPDGNAEMRRISSATSSAYSRGRSQLSGKYQSRSSGDRTFIVFLPSGKATFHISQNVERIRKTRSRDGRRKRTRLLPFLWKD